MPSSPMTPTEELLPRSKKVKVGDRDFELREMSATDSDAYEQMKLQAVMDMRQAIRDELRPLELAGVRSLLLELTSNTDVIDEDWHRQAQALLVRDELTTQEVIRARQAGDQAMRAAYDGLFAWMLFGCVPPYVAESNAEAAAFLAQHVSHYTVRKRLIEIQDELNAIEERKNAGLPVVG